jgi:hypothetical protein
MWKWLVHRVKEFSELLVGRYRAQTETEDVHLDGLYIGKGLVSFYVDGKYVSYLWLVSFLCGLLVS